MTWYVFGIYYISTDFYELVCMQKMKGEGPYLLNNYNVCTKITKTAQSYKDHIESLSFITF